MYLYVPPEVTFRIAVPAEMAGPGQAARKVMVFPLIPLAAHAPFVEKSL